MSTKGILGTLFPSRTSFSMSARPRSGGRLAGWLSVVCACLGIALSARAAAPVFNSPTPNQTVLIDEPTDAIQLDATDVETTKLNLVFRGLSSNPNLVPTNNIFYGSAVGENFVTVTPAFGQTGTCTITNIVRDQSGFEATNSFTFTVNGTPAGYTRFIQTNAITIPGIAGVATNANPYPSTNLVSGMTGWITNMTLTFSRLSHSRIQDVNMLLVAPNGTGIVIFAEVSGQNRACTNVTVNLADGLTYPLPPDFDLWSERLTPQDFQGGGYFPGLPWTNAPVFFSSFNGASPNGTWKLYIYDDAAGNNGTMAGWSMKIATSTGPTISDIGNQSTAINTPTAAIPFTIGDPDGLGGLVLLKSSSNTGLVPTNNIVFGGSGANRTVTVTPATAQTGTAIITIFVTDGTSTNSDSFTVTVGANGNPPTISSIPNKTTLAGRAVGPFNITIGDVETAVGNLVLTGSSSNTNLIPNGNIIFFNSGVTTLTVAPADGQTGTATITVNVMDEASNITSTNFDVTVSAAVSPTGIFDETNNISVPAGSSATVYPSTNIVSGLAGTITAMTLTLKHLTHPTPYDLEMLLVSPGGQKSVFFSRVSSNAANDVTVTVDDTATYQLPPIPYGLLTGTYKSADFGHGTFPAPAPSAPYGTDLSAFTGASPNGNWRLFVRNASGGAGAGSIVGGWSLAITTTGGSTGPTISDIGNQSILINSNTGALPFTIDDPDTSLGSLVLTASSSNNGLAPTNNIVFGGSGANRTVTVTPVIGQTGSATITIVVSDGSSTASDSFLLSVTTPGGGNPPTIDAIPNKTTLSGRAVGPFNIAIGDVETSVGNLILTGSSSNTNLVPNDNIIFFNSGVTTLTVAPKDGVTGTTVITVNVKDEANNTTSTDFTLTVNGAGSGTGLFDNTNSISIPTASAATVYPSTNVVSGMGSSISAITLTLKRITHGAPHDLEMMLVSPGGQKSVFFAHVGGGTMTNVTVTVDDSATYQLPPSPYATLTGTYKSADFGHDTFPGGAPSGPYGTNLSNTFIGASPNGTWSLYVMNDPAGTAAGTIAGGWSLAITTPGLAPTISDIPNQSISISNATGPIAFTISDGDTATSNLVLSATSSNAGLVPTNGINFGGTGANRTVTISPTVGQIGFSTINITVSDGVNTANDSFLLTVTPTVLSTLSFSNTTPITIPSVGGSSPYPSVINVAGMPGTVSNVTVTLRNFSHTWGSDVDLLLVGPMGTNMVLMSDSASSVVSTVTFTLSDAAALPIPAAGSGLTAGTYLPTNRVDASAGGDNFTAPAPAAPFGTTLGVFNGASPNGTWSLYVYDDGTGDTGSIAGGWSMTITTVSAPNFPPTISDIGNQSIFVNANTGALPFTISDEESPGASLTLSAASSNTNLVTTNNIVFGGSGTNRTVTVTPAAGFTGTSTITITVSDGTNSTSDAFLLTVNQVGGNTPPYFTMAVADQTALVGRSAGPLNIDFTDDETPNGLSVVGASSNTNLVPNANIVFYNGPGQRTLTVTPVDGIVGTTTITVLVSDGVYNTIETFFFTTTLPGPLAAIFDKTNSITLPAAAVASAYPSTNRVAGMPGLITDVTLTLKGLSHQVETNLQMLLVSPAGNKVVVMARVGGGTPSTNITVTLDDSSTYALPPLGYSILSGTYRPTDGGHVAFPGPAPGETYATTMADFDGVSPNGDWLLYIYTSAAGTGTLAQGWSLAITTDTTNTAPTISAISNKTNVVNTATAAIPFTISDAQTAASSLVLTAFSSNTNLVPTNKIVFGGSGGSRTVTVTPSSNVLGNATISLTVSDGILSTSTNFVLVVNPAVLTVTGNNTNRMYGTTNPVITSSIVGLQAGDTITATFGNAANTNSPVGIYTNTVTLTDVTGHLGNYVVTTNLGTLTITNAPLTVVANSSNKVYGTTRTLLKTDFTILSGTLFSGSTLTNVTLTSAGTNVAAVIGTYPIIPSAAAGSNLANYAITYSNGTLTVTPAALTVTANSSNKVYGTTRTFAGTEFAITGGVLTNGNTLTGVTLASAGTNVAAPIGAYPITATSAVGAGISNYTITYLPGTLTVTTAPLTVTANTTNKVYGTLRTFAGTEFAITSGILTNGNTLTSATLDSAATNVAATIGTYPISVTNAAGTGLSNYTITYLPGAMTVTGSPLTVTANSTNKVYGTTLSLSGAEFALTSGALTNGDTLTSVTLASAGTDPGAAVGAYLISVTNAAGAGLTNYAITYVPGTLTVGAASLTIVPADTNKIYGATLNPTVYSTIGLLNGDSVTNVTLASAGSVSNAPVGSYAINASSALGVGLTNYVIGYSNATLTVNAAGLLVTTLDTNKVYGAALSPTGFTVSGLLNDDTVTNATLSSAGSETNASVGGYAISATVQGTGLTNYSIGFSNGTLTVNAANLLITALDTNKTYGATLNPTEFTVAGLVNSDSVTNVTLASAGSSAGAVVGTYPIVPSSALGVGLTNYNIGYSNGTLTVDAALVLVVTPVNTNKTYGSALTFAGTDFMASGLIGGDSVTNVTLTSVGAGTNAPVGSYVIVPSNAQGSGLGNYTIIYSNANLTVNPASLLVTTLDTNKVYGAALTPAGLTISGLLNSDTVTNATLSSAGSETNAPVGGYPISAAVQGPGLTNYTIGYSNGTLTVGAASLLISAHDTNKAYGTTLNLVDYTATGLLNGDSVTNVTLSTAGSVSNAPVGSYAINVSSALGVGLTNYVIGYSNATLAVGAASLLITTHDTNKVYGATLNPADYTAAGLLNGDAVTNVTLTSAGSVSNAPIGGYAINASGVLGVGLTNYVIGYSNGTLTVGAASLLITTGSTNKIYGATLSPVAYTVAGLLNGDSVTNVTLTSAGSVSNAPIGSYVINAVSAGGVGLTNYTIGYSNGTLTVGAAGLVITPANTDKFYGATLNPTAYNVAGLLNGDAVTSVTLASTGSVSNAPVGSYVITASLAQGAGLTNYAITYNTGIMTVSWVYLTVTPGGTNKVYGTQLTPTGYTVSGLLNGDSVTNVILASAGALTNAPVGSYAITVGAVEGAGLSNYVVLSETNTLTVTPATLTVAAGDTNKVYGVALNPSLYTAAGLLNGDSVTNVTLASAGSVSNAPIGSYTINASGALGVGLTNYTIGYSNGTLTVGAANLLVTAGNTNKVYGATLNPTDYAAAGLLNGDSVTNVTVTSAGSVSNAPVGSYAINASSALGVGLTNYVIGYSNGTLTVAAASLLISAHDTNKIYGTTLNPTDYTATGLLNSDSVTNVALTSTGSVSNAPAGSYAINASSALGVGLTNYVIGYSNGTLTVGAASLLITVGNTNKVYGATLNPTDYTAAGLLNGDSVTNVTLTSAGSVSNAPAGSYAINASGALGVGLTNYVIGYSNGTLAVGAASLTITANNASKAQGSTLNFTGNEFVTAGLLNGDNVLSASLSSAGAGAGAAAGTYPIVATNAVGSGLSNYTIAYVNGTLTVTNAGALFEITSISVLNGVATITWNSASNQSYVLQYKDDLMSTNWLEVPATIVATNSSASTTNLLGGAPQRFYRVRQGTAAAAAPAPQITSIVPSGGNVVVTWTSVAGHFYRLQYNDDLTTTNWTDVLPEVTAAGPSSSATNSVAGVGQRFYRVWLRE